MASSAFSKLTCIQLRQELGRRGAKTTGRKSELLQRLEDYERNQDFRGQPVIMPENVLVDWPSTGFSQLTANHIQNQGLPPLKFEHIEGYFMHRMGLDSRAVGDAQALTKGKLLIESNRVEACSFLQQNKAFYFSGICRAAMKKSLRYSLKVKVDCHGDVINSHCECPSGTGPHGTCKHVAALLLTLVSIMEEGEMSGMNESCTDTLQTFHKPTKLYGGSPVKAQDMPGCLTVDLSDPRPPHLRGRENRQDCMRNLVINFVANTGKNITARYIFPGANLQAAADDHSYLDAPLTEHMVHNRLKISSDGAALLERKTVKQSKSHVWHEEREWRLTASRFGEVCKMTARRNIQKLCKSLLGDREINSPALSHGRTHEPIAIKEFEKKTGRKVKKCGLYVDPEYPYLAATPDGLVGSDAIVEVKCPYAGRKKKIRPGEKFPFLEQKNGKLSLKRSHNYYDQVQGQLLLAKRKKCFFVVYTKVSLKVIRVQYDEEYSKKSLIPKLKSFFDTKYVKFLAKRL